MHRAHLVVQFHDSTDEAHVFSFGELDTILCPQGACADEHLGIKEDLFIQNVVLLGDHMPS